MRRLSYGFGSLLAVAMLVAALGASSASATTLEQCGGPGTPTGETAAFECPTVGSHNFWTNIPANSALTITGVGVSTLSATVAGVPFKIECKKQEGMAVSKNVETGGNMLVEGTGTNEYKECTVVEPGSGVCTVAEPIVTNELVNKTVAGKMLDEYKPVGTNFVTLTIGGASCPAALKGSKNVTGKAVASGNEATGEETFNAEGSELKVAGQAATLISTIKRETTGTTSVVISRTP